MHVKKLGIPIETVNRFDVQLGNRETIACKHICWRVDMMVGNVVIQEDFYPFELDSVEAAWGLSGLSH